MSKSSTDGNSTVLNLNIITILQYMCMDILQIWAQASCAIRKLEHRMPTNYFSKNESLGQDQNKEVIIFWSALDSI